jgi:hypothetical protein
MTGHQPPQPAAQPPVGVEQPSRTQRETAQINRWANRALRNLLAGWPALAEYQVRQIIEFTGGLDQAPDPQPTSPTDGAQEA